MNEKTRQPLYQLMIGMTEIYDSGWPSNSEKYDELMKHTKDPLLSELTFNILTGILKKLENNTATELMNQMVKINTYRDVEHMLRLHSIAIGMGINNTQIQFDKSTNSEEEIIIDIIEYDSIDKREIVSKLLILLALDLCDRRLLIELICAYRSNQNKINFKELVKRSLPLLNMFTKCNIDKIVCCN